MLTHDNELERTLRNMNPIIGTNDDDPHQNMPASIDVNGQLIPDAPGENQQRG